MFRFLFLDLDDTLLDFHKAEAIAVDKAFRAVGVQPTPELIARYSAVNKLHWQMLERGELTREEVLVERFAYLFREQGIPADPAACKTYYEDYLCLGHFFMPGAEDILAYLAPRYRLYLASNGTARVQESRLKSAGIGGYFEQVFISLMVGDSLTSDIRGANGAGMAACWLNPRHEARLPDVTVDYEIRALAELREFL